MQRLPPTQGIDPRAVLPHRGTMLLLDTIDGYTPRSLRARAVADAAAWYAVAGEMPSWIGIELMAQAIAAHVNLLGRAADGAPRRGVLLGTRRYRSGAASFAAGGLLVVDAELSFRDDSGLGAYDCTIACAGAVVAQATVKVFEPEDFAAFVAAPAVEA